MQEMASYQMKLSLLSHCVLISDTKWLYASKEQSKENIIFTTILWEPLQTLSCKSLGGATGNGVRGASFIWNKWLTYATIGQAS